MKRIILLTALVSTGTAFWLTPRAESTCSAAGLQCSPDCHAVQYCSASNSNPSTIRECPASSFCSNSTGVPECDASSCPTAKPLCPLPGAIPSPTDCHIYYVCTAIGDADPLLIECPNSGVYNTKTFQCEAGLKCREPVKCAKPGDFGIVDPENGLFCYYCSDINTPYVYPCKS